MWIKAYFLAVHGIGLTLGACVVWSVSLSVCLSEPLLSVGPDSPSSRATNLRRSSVTKLVLKLMRRVNILRQAVCIRPLTGFMFRCNLCLSSLGNSLRPRPLIYGDLWWKVWGLAHVPACLGRGTGIKTRCGDTFWRHADKIWYGTVADNFVRPLMEISTVISTGDGVTAPECRHLWRLTRVLRFLCRCTTGSGILNAFTEWRWKNCLITAYAHRKNGRPSPSSTSLHPFIKRSKCECRPSH